MAKTLKVSPEAAAIAAGYDRLIEALDVPVIALQKLCNRASAGVQRFRTWRAKARQNREHRNLQRRILATVLRHAEGLR